eukprot:5788633-Prymnesium_polylepis.1
MCGCPPAPRVYVVRLWNGTGLAFERPHTVIGLREGVHTPFGGANTGSVHIENVVFTQKKWCSH